VGVCVVAGGYVVAWPGCGWRCVGVGGVCGLGACGGGVRRGGVEGAESDAPGDREEGTSGDDWLVFEWRMPLFTGLW